MKLPDKRVLVVIATALSVASCSSSSGSSTGPGTGPTTFQGVFAADTKSGVLTLVSGSPASGELAFSGGPTVALSGTFTSSTSAFAMTGGGYAVSATVNSSNQLSGTLTGTGIATAGSLVAQAVATTATAIRYCGMYTGGDNGRINFSVLGQSVAAVATVSGGNLTGFGSFDSSSHFTVVFVLKDGSNKKVNVKGDKVLLYLTGTWSNEYGESGVFNSSQTLC